MVSFALLARFFLFVVAQVVHIFWYPVLWAAQIRSRTIQKTTTKNKYDNSVVYSSGHDEDHRYGHSPDLILQHSDLCSLYDVEDICGGPCVGYSKKEIH